MTTLNDYWTFESGSAKNRRLLRQEELILQVTEELASVLDREGIKKAQLAEKLGKSKAFVSQIMNGGRNLTLRTLADVADALDYRIKVRLQKELGGGEFSYLVWHNLEAWRVSFQETR